MTTIFVVCFVAGLGLSVVSFVSGLHHRVLHLPRMLRHHGSRKSSSMINAAALTAFHRAGRPMEGFFVRKQAKGHGSKDRLEGQVKAGD